MEIMEFHVCHEELERQWVVELDNEPYGSYVDKEQALLDAVDAARDARQAGHDAQVYLREHAVAARIF